MFLITGAFENQQYTWKPICWHKCSNKVVNFQLTLSIIGRKQILTWPLSRLIQFTVTLLQSSYENAVCRIHHCKSWNSKFLTHATKSLPRHCIYKMILWKISSSRDWRKSSSVCKMCEWEKSWLSSWLWKACPALSNIMPSSWQSNAAKGKMPCTLGVCPRNKPVIPPALLLNSEEFGGLKAKRRSADLLGVGQWQTCFSSLSHLLAATSSWGETPSDQASWTS